VYSLREALALQPVIEPCTLYKAQAVLRICCILLYSIEVKVFSAVLLRLSKQK
jgi:hypothetical protein